MNRFFPISVIVSVTALLFVFSYQPYAPGETLQGGAFTGVVSGDRVNVRADDNISSEVLCQVSKGEKVNALGLKGKWYKIELPKKAPVYIAKSNVSKRDGEGTVTEDKANIRVAATISSSVVGRLNKGATVKIRKEYLDWYEIEAPMGSFGWVSSDYIKKIGGAAVLKPTLLSEKLALLDATYAAELKKPLREIELKWTLEGYEKFASDNKGTPEEKDALLKANEIKLKMAQIEHLKAKEEYEARIKDISSPRPGEVPIVSGVVDNVGKIPGRLSRFKIVKDGKSLGYLTSSKVDLDGYVKLPVKIWGVKKDVRGTPLYEADAVQIIE